MCSPALLHHWVVVTFTLQLSAAFLMHFSPSSKLSRFLPNHLREFDDFFQLRESSIRRLSHEVANALLTIEPSNGERLDRIWRCTAEMIAKAAEDKVYKVYSAAIKALKSLLAFTHFAPDLNYVQAGIRPIIYSILLKCADGQKRMAELSLETIHDLCRNDNFLVGSAGYYATGQKPRYLFLKNPISKASKKCLLPFPFRLAFAISFML